MKLTIVLTTTLALGFLTWAAQAQQGGPGRGPGGPGRGPQGNAGPPLHPLWVALDLNQDGVISNDEIRVAARSLRKLDTNRDGQIDHNEIRPPGRGFGAGPLQPRPDQPDPGQPGPDQPAPDQPPTLPNFAERIMSFDADGDGKVSREEMPPRMQGMMQWADTNQDGSLDQQEAEAMAQRLRQRNQDAPAGPGQGQGRGAGRGRNLPPE